MSQFDGVELIWMFFSAEPNFSCWSISYQAYYPWLCNFILFYSAIWWHFSEEYHIFLSVPNWRNIVKHREIVILFPLHYLGWWFPLFPLTHAHTHLHETHNTLVPPQTTHGGTLCSWVGWTIFGRGGGWPRAEATFCGAVLLSDLFWNLSDSRRLAHMEGVAAFGKRPRIFWQNRSQLQGQNVVCVSLWGCASLMSWRFDGGVGCAVGGGVRLECYTSVRWLEHISF